MNHLQHKDIARLDNLLKGVGQNVLDMLSVVKEMKSDERAVPRQDKPFPFSYEPDVEMPNGMHKMTIGIDMAKGKDMAAEISPSSEHSTEAKPRAYYHGNVSNKKPELQENRSARVDRKPYRANARPNDRRRSNDPWDMPPPPTGFEKDSRTKRSKHSHGKRRKRR